MLSKAERRRLGRRESLTPDPEKGEVKELLLGNTERLDEKGGGSRGAKLRVVHDCELGASKRNREKLRLVP